MESAKHFSWSFGIILPLYQCPNQSDQGQREARLDSASCFHSIFAAATTVCLWAASMEVVFKEGSYISIIVESSIGGLISKHFFVSFFVK